MSALALHPMSTSESPDGGIGPRPVRLTIDDLLVRASKDGDEVTGHAGGIVLYARNELKRRARTITITGLPGNPADEYTHTVAAGVNVMIGPFGFEMGDLGLEAYRGGEIVTLKIAYSDNRGLRICAVSPE